MFSQRKSSGIFHPKVWISRVWWCLWAEPTQVLKENGAQAHQNWIRSAPHNKTVGYFI